MDSGRFQLNLSAMALLQKMEASNFSEIIETTKLNGVLTQKYSFSK
jgi:hypothetical protein